jgi:hypothetical protein
VYVVGVVVPFNGYSFYQTGQHFIFQPSAPIALVIVFLAYTLLFFVLGPIAVLYLFLVPILGFFSNAIVQR